MIPQPFEYHVAKSVNEAAQLAAQFGGDGKILAGGHSLVPMMRLRLAAPKHIVDITRIPDLAYIREEGDKIEIGALTTHYRIESSDLLRQKCPVFPETAREIGDAQVRNKGTLGGSLAHADPASDWPAAILATNAEIHAVGLNSDRWIPAASFFVDILTTALEPGEILTGIRVPQLSERAGDAYVKLHQPASGFAIVGVAARVVLNTQGAIEQASIGITGIGPKAYRATGVESALRGKSTSPKHLEEASGHAADGVEPNSDLYASAEYRAHLARIYTRRALEKAVERAGAK